MSDFNQISVERACKHAFQYLKIIGQKAWDEFPVDSYDRYTTHQLVH